MLRNKVHIVSREDIISLICVFAIEEGARSGMEKENNKVRLLFVGSPLLDISATCDSTLLHRFELKEDDCVRAKKEHDSLFEHLFLNEQSKLAAGGSAQNAARLAKWKLGSRGEVSFAGCAGDDDLESWMRLKLESEGVLALYFKVPGLKTGVCACMLTQKGKRSMCTRQGAAAKFNVDHLHRQDFQKILKKAHCVFIVGFFLAHSPDVVAALAEMCVPGQVFCLSLSAEYISRDCLEALLRVLPRVDVLFGNEAEVKAFATAMGADGDVTVEDAISILRQQPRPPNTYPRIVVVTRGPDPLLVDDGTDHIKTFTIQKDVQVVDSIGCGDALCGAFLATYMLNRDVESAATEGIVAALHILQVEGCNPPVLD